MTPLVLLPGTNCSPDLWSGVADDLDAVHAPIDASTLDGCVDALLARLPARFALAGLSLGGIVAMALTRRAPERVERLCLIATNARAPVPAQLAAWSAQRAALRAGRTARDLQGEALPALVHRHAPAVDERVLAMADAVGEWVLDRQLALQATRVDERPGLRRVGVPTLVVAGAEDGVCPPANHVEIAGAVPGAVLHVVPEAGHLVPLDQPQAVAGLLRSWLAG